MYGEKETRASESDRALMLASEASPDPSVAPKALSAECTKKERQLSSLRGQQLHGAPSPHGLGKGFVKDK